LSDIAVGVRVEVWESSDLMNWSRSTITQQTFPSDQPNSSMVSFFRDDPLGEAKRLFMQLQAFPTP